MTRFSLHSALVAGFLSVLLIGYFAATGRFGPSTAEAIAFAAAHMAMIGSALAVAHFICGALIGARIEEARIGLMAVLLMATAFAALVLLVLTSFNLLLLATGAPGSLPHFADLGLAMTAISWGSWLFLYRVELRKRLDEERDATRRR